VPCTAALLLAGIEPELDVRGEQVWAQHQHPVIIGRHSVRLSDDVTVTVAEDEPVKVSSSSSIRALNQVLQQPSCTCRGMPLTGSMRVGSRTAQQRAAYSTGHWSCS
jgi:hypothetical protein